MMAWQFLMQNHSDESSPERTAKKIEAIAIELTEAPRASVYQD